MNGTATTSELNIADGNLKPPRASRVGLSCGDYALALLPDLGGALARFIWRGRDVLRPAPADVSSPFDTASFPLAPYSNRIAAGAFRFEGHKVSLTPNFGSHPHPMHGQAWLAPWRVEERTKNTARLVFVHDAPDEWPWAYSVEQAIVLSPDGLRIDLRITNLSDTPMPASYGFHPYFPKSPSARLYADVSGVWLADENSIPTVLAGRSHFLPLDKGADLTAAPFVDHCHAGWCGVATFAQPAHDMTIEMTASPDLGFLHIYATKDAPYFCAEPVSAMPNAANRSEPCAVTGLRTMAPGETVSAYMTLSARIGGDSAMP